jgi:two-component system sensor histidine kinase AlgZ
MNTIASLIRRNPALAEEVVEDLSDLFRASLQDSQRPSTLGDEMELCRRYLRIEQQRLGSRLNAVWQLDNLPLGTPLPALSIQPLLENAIYHGIEPVPGGGTITILGSLAQEGIRIVIKNPLSQTNSKSPARSGNRIAQDNVRQRLGSFFSQDDLLEVSQDEHSYRVSVTIPLPR